ncbi:hypothetical protein EB796_006441 [Bugula neritina]|uniref:Uncharacterized protein n=1 Tax=Bugula neritina TaxID=10212 RepID=A0A7J7KAH8_BUGNE|nr:hypothetical protein EB796_006441 [Bugula neritina]
MAGMKQYNEFLQAYLAANSGLPKQKAYTNAQEKWNIGNVQRQAKSRLKRKAGLELLSQKYPEINVPRPKQGRPPLEEKQSDLLETIKEIATLGGAADDRRRSESIRLCRTLDDLVAELQKAGYHISRSAAYIRLIPHRWNTNEGKRHVNTVPVKLLKARNDEHRAHQDSKFAAATVKYVHQLAAALGPSEVLFISQNDIARVPIGITAAKQTGTFTNVP